MVAWAKKERRASERRSPIHCPITFVGADQTLRGGHVVDLSLAGCAVQSKESVREGDYLSLLVQVPDHGPPTGVYKAQVRWSRGKKFGIEFLQMPPEAQERIRQFVSCLESKPSH